jgi:hypothetical protein
MKHETKSTAKNIPDNQSFITLAFIIHRLIYILPELIWNGYILLI